MMYDYYQDELGAIKADLDDFQARREAVNEAIRQADELSQKEMGRLTGGLPTGGLF